jgi:Flp pilus assembly protein TadD
VARLGSQQRLFFVAKTSGDKGKSGPKRDPRKARKFFEHAETVADARNYDYAIELYISGLKIDPDNLPKHEALHEVAKRRKVAGGKPAGFMEKLKSGGSSPLEKMLHAEKLWSMDMLNGSHAAAAMEHAVKADQDDEELNLAEVAYWLGSTALDLHAQSGKAKKGDKVLRTLTDNFRAIGAYDKAVDACRHLLRMDQTNSALLQELKDLEAENTMQRGGYGTEAKAEEGGFRKFVRDEDKQKALEQDDSITQLRTRSDEIIARRRAEMEEDPEDLDKRQKLIQALLAKESMEAENEAVDLLKQSHEETGQYRYKVQMGDVQIKQYNRIIRQLRSQLKESPEDPKLKTKYDEARKRQLSFELKEFQERVKNYPTDLSLKFEYGRRLHAASQFDEAIGMFQQAKQDPKHRAVAHQYLGDAYLRKGWLDEAVDTLRQGIEQYQAEDRLGMEMRYTLMNALEQSATKNNDLDQAQEAQKVASQILQTDIGFKDIRERAENLRQLVDKMRG